MTVINNSCFRQNVFNEVAHYCAGGLDEFKDFQGPVQ